MKIALKGIQNIEYQQASEIKVKDGWLNVEVMYCAVCRTDAKLWNEGHRDLVLPRVPGHEVVVRYKNELYTVWPGNACGVCKHCVEGNENLCDKMKIIGFHLDGGFSSNLLMPQECLIPINTIEPIYACFAEPVGCIVNAYKKLKLKAKERIIIYGAGTIGLLSALVAKEYGAEPVVIEKNDTKVSRAKAFSEQTSIPVVKELSESKFDCAINACADPIAFLNCLTRVRKSGRIVHFSGLSKNEHFETNLANIIHYKELSISGAYGLTKADMEKGLGIIENLTGNLNLLIEDRIEPTNVESVLRDVIESKVYKYIIDFRSDNSISFSASEFTEKKKVEKTKYFNYPIPELSGAILSKAQEKIDNKTKPLGALGTLEKLAVKIAQVQNTLEPVFLNSNLFVFAADHGIAEEGVSAFPQKVTREMVNNFLNKGAAINVICNHYNIKLSVFDLGINGNKIEHSNLITQRIARGTKNFALEKAMTQKQALKAIETGIKSFEKAYNDNKIDIIGLGEMGIANTSSATAIISVITGKSVKECTWRGTGIDDQALEHKTKVIRNAINYHKPNRYDAVEILSCIGGFEIGAMAGVALAAASKKCTIVLDGLISTAAGLLAYTINPDIADYFIAGHKSVEVAHCFALNHMKLEPVLDLNMRLGEGTGAAITINLCNLACDIMRDMASFDEAGVTNNCID